MKEKHDEQFKQIDRRGPERRQLLPLISVNEKGKSDGSQRFTVDPEAIEVIRL